MIWEILNSVNLTTFLLEYPRLTFSFGIRQVVGLWVEGPPQKSNKVIEILSFYRFLMFFVSVSGQEVETVKRRWYLLRKWCSRSTLRVKREQGREDKRVDVDEIEDLSNYDHTWSYRPSVLCLRCVRCVSTWSGNPKFSFIKFYGLKIPPFYLFISTSLTVKDSQTWYANNIVIRRI